MDFEAEMRRAVAGVTGGTPQVGEVDGLVARPDGNNVSMDREAMQMAQSQLEFRTGVELLRQQYTMLTDAIKSDGK
jgi:flagellar basal-body rod protein FlgB